MKALQRVVQHAGRMVRLFEKAWIPLVATSALFILASYLALPDLPSSSPRGVWADEKSAVFSRDGRVADPITRQESGGAIPLVNGMEATEVQPALGRQSMLEKLHSGRKMHIQNASPMEMSMRSQLLEPSDHTWPPKKRSLLAKAFQSFGYGRPPDFDLGHLNFSTGLLSDLSPTYITKMRQTYSRATSDNKMTLVVNVQHGLGNRLRALASGQAVAAASGRHFRLLWLTDSHCGARFQDLFDCPEIDVWDTFDEREVNGSNFHRYNYMENEEGSKKNEVILTKVDRHIYVKSAYRLRSDQRVLTEDLHKALKALHPSKAVMRHIRVVEQKLKNMQFRILHRAAPSWSHPDKSKRTGGTYIGVHIRTNQPDAEPGFTLPDSAYTPEGWATIKQMRSRTRVEVFIAEIERLFESDPGLLVFLAADHANTYSTIQKAFGKERVLWLEKNGCLDRRPRCQQMALADMYILSRSSQILGSSWSSFTEVAALFTRVPVRIAGQDFFLPPPPKHAPVLCNPPSMDHPARFHGTSLFTAVMGRKDALEKVLPSWLRVREVDEIVIVDWGSEPPLRPFIEWFQDGRIKLVEVPDETRWVLSRAMNLAARHTSGNRLLKVDSDTFLEEDFLEAHPLNETGKAFWSGNWKTARNQNEKHLNGVVYLPRREWILVNGYDECVISYGWEDEDLYRRLGMYGNLRKDFDYSKIRHLEHADTERMAKQQPGDEGVAPPWEVHMNIIIIKILSGMLSPWNQGTEGAHYNCSQEKPWVCECATYSVPPQLEDLVPKERLELAHLGALGGELRSVTGAAFDVMTLSAVRSEDWFFKQLELHYPTNTRRPVIVAQLLGCCLARVEALLLARRLALKRSRPLRVVWQPSERDGCPFSFWNLFTQRQDTLHEAPSLTAVRQTSVRERGATSDGAERDVRLGTNAGPKESYLADIGAAEVSGVETEPRSGEQDLEASPEKASSETASETEDAKKSAEYSLGGVLVEVTEEFFEWEVIDGLYDVIDTVTHPKVGLPRDAPGEKHVFLRLRLAGRGLEPVAVRDLAGGTVWKTGEDSQNGDQSGDVKRKSMVLGEKHVGEILKKMELELTGEVSFPTVDETDAQEGENVGGGNGERTAASGGIGDEPAGAGGRMTSAPCEDPGALLVRLSGGPLERLLALSSAHTFAAALGRRLVAWWPADNASYGLSFADLFVSSEVDIRNGSGPTLAVSNKRGTDSTRGVRDRQPGRALLEEELRGLGDETGVGVEHGRAGRAQRKKKMLSELLHRLQIRDEPELQTVPVARGSAGKNGGSVDKTNRQEGGELLEDRIEAGFVKFAEQTIVDTDASLEEEKGVGAALATNGENAEETDRADGTDQEEKSVRTSAFLAAATDADLEEGSRMLERVDVLESEQETAVESDVAPTEAQDTEVGSNRGPAKRLVKMDPIGMLDLDKTGRPLPVVEPLPQGGAAWYAWDPPFWDVGIPVVPLTEAVGSHLLLSLNGSLMALGDHFVATGTPGWRHPALQPAPGLAEVLERVGDTFLQAGIGERRSSEGGGNSEELHGGGESKEEKEKERRFLVLFVGGGSLGGCASLDAALNRILLLMADHSAHLAKARLLERLVIVEQSRNATAVSSINFDEEIKRDRAARAELDSNNSVKDIESEARGKTGSESEICLEAIKLARNLNSTHSDRSRIGPHYLTMPQCATLQTPTEPASEQGVRRSLDTASAQGSDSQRRAPPVEHGSGRACLLEELAAIMLLSEKAERVFSFEGTAAVDLAAAWGPGSKFNNRITCPQLTSK